MARKVVGVPVEVLVQPIRDASDSADPFVVVARDSRLDAVADVYAAVVQKPFGIRTR